MAEYTKKEIYERLVRADEEGDTESVNTLKAYIRVKYPTGPQAEPARPEYAAPRQAAQGLTYGFGDEIVGAIGATIDTVGEFFTGEDTGDWGDKYTEIRDSERAKIKEYEDNYAAEALAMEIAGGIIAPGGIARTALNTAGKQMLGTGAAYGLGKSEGSTVEDYVWDAGKGAAFGFAFGKGAEKIIGGAKNTAEKVFGINKVPSIDDLYKAKTVAYGKITAFMKKTGHKYNINHADDLMRRVKEELSDTSNIDTAGKGTELALKALNKLLYGNKAKLPPKILLTSDKNQKAGKDAFESNFTIGQLDKARSTIHGIFERHPNEIGIRRIIAEMDNMVYKNTPAEASLLIAARQANMRYKKSELLGDIMDSARASGDNNGLKTYDMMKKGVQSILNKNSKDRKWFSQEEIALMEKFVKGTPGMWFKRKVGKLSPDGTGLLKAFAYLHNPGMAVASAGAGMTANKLASSSGQAQGVNLVGMMGGSKPQTAINPKYTQGFSSGMMGQSEVFQNK
jgi:hypothetical protein